MIWDIHRKARSQNKMEHTNLPAMKPIQDGFRTQLDPDNWRLSMGRNSNGSGLRGARLILARRGSRGLRLRNKMQPIQQAGKREMCAEEERGIKKILINNIPKDFKCEPIIKKKKKRSIRAFKKKTTHASPVAIGWSKQEWRAALHHPDQPHRFSSALAGAERNAPDHAARDRPRSHSRQCPRGCAAARTALGTGHKPRHAQHSPICGFLTENTPQDLAQSGVVVAWSPALQDCLKAAGARWKYSDV